MDRRFVVWQVMLYNQGKIKVYFWGISTLGHFQSKKCKKIIFTSSAGYIRKPRNINIYFCGEFWWFCKLVVRYLANYWFWKQFTVKLQQSTQYTLHTHTPIWHHFPNTYCLEFRHLCDQISKVLSSHATARTLHLAQHIEFQEKQKKL